MDTWGPMEAIPPLSVISLRRLGGAPDLRVPCVFSQQRDGYNPIEVNYPYLSGHIIGPFGSHQIELLCIPRNNPPYLILENYRHVRQVNSEPRVLLSCGLVVCALRAP